MTKNLVCKPNARYIYRMEKLFHNKKLLISLAFILGPLIHGVLILQASKYLGYSGSGYAEISCQIGTVADAIGAD